MSMTEHGIFVRRTYAQDVQKPAAAVEAGIQRKGIATKKTSNRISNSSGLAAAITPVAGPFVIRRVFKPTSLPSINQLVDYLTARRSWTNNPGIAERFKTQRQAEYVLLRVGKGEVIPESAIGK